MALHTLYWCVSVVSNCLFEMYYASNVVCQDHFPSFISNSFSAVVVNLS